MLPSLKWAANLTLYKTFVFVRFFYPGPVVERYVERNFQDEDPSGREADVYIALLVRDFAKDKE